jgi:3-oxoacyl-[acyl-carrier protein] reductase
MGIMSEAASGEIVETFEVTAAAIAAFAAATGDRSSLHTDPEFARRSRFRHCVAHGMLAVAMLGRVAGAFEGRAFRLREIQGRFTHPIPIGATIRLFVEIGPPMDDEHTFKARWENTEDRRVVATAAGRFKLGGPNTPGKAAAPGVPTGLLTAPVDEADQGAEALDGATASLQFKVTDAALANLARIAAPGAPLDAFCSNLATTLLLSTLVGMRLPGRRAVFMRFAMKFAADVARDVESELHGRVTKVSAVSESLVAEVRITQQQAEIATGEVHAVVSQAPSRMLSAETIRRDHLQLGLAGKVVVVIGASRGIGETAAKLFAMHGARVVVHYFRGRQDAESIVAEIAAAGGTARALQCDVRDEAEVGRFFAEVDQAFGGLDVLVNNAVVDFQPKAAMELTWPDFLGELEVSLKGLHACCQAAVPRMKVRGGGKIVNVSTVAVDQPVRGQGKYITAKSAVAGYTKSLAVEVLKDNIQVNLVVPAMTETDLLASIPGDFVQRIASERGMGRNVRPIEVAQAMVYLASDWSGALSGQRLVLNLGESPFA